MIDMSYAGVFGMVMAATITPGPNNIIVFQTGIAHGIGPAVRASLAIMVGTLVLLTVTLLGGAALITTMPVAQVGFSILGASILCWAAHGLIRQSLRKREVKPTSVLAVSPSSIAWFQLVNPKAWALCVAAVSASQLIRDDLTGGLLLAALFLSAVVLSLAIWITAARVLPVRSGQGAALRVLNAVSGVCLLGFAAFTLASGL